MRATREDDACADNNVMYQYHQWFENNLEKEIKEKENKNVMGFIMREWELRKKININSRFLMRIRFGSFCFKL